MNYRKGSYPMLLAAALLAVGCTSGEPRSSSDTSGNFNDCFFTRSLSDWRPLDDENLILFAGRRRPYHVQLVRPAFGLDRDFMIGVYDRDGSICPYGGDAIVIGGIMPETIRIRSMQRISTDELDQLYINFGIVDPAAVEVTPVEIVDEAPEDNGAPTD